MIWMFTIMANAMLTVTVTVMAITKAILIMMLEALLIKLFQEWGPYQ